MSKQRIVQMIILGIKQFRDPYYQGFAAQVAFFFILSLVPIIILLSRLLAFFSISLEALTGWIQEYVPGEFASTLIGLVTYTPASAMNIVFVVIAVWAASRAQFSLMRITNYTLTEGKSTGNGYFRERLRALKTMVLTLFTLAFALIILVYGELLFGILAKALTQNLNVDYELANFWLIIRWPIAMALYFLMVSYIYYVLPSEKVKFTEILPGSIFAAVGMLLITLLYSYYANRVAQYDIIYGSLATIVALMFWFYFLAWALGLGVLCNKVWADTRETSKV